MELLHIARAEPKNKGDKPKMLVTYMFSMEEFEAIQKEAQEKENDKIILSN
jgi:hypothetical protein